MQGFQTSRKEARGAGVAAGDRNGSGRRGARATVGIPIALWADRGNRRNIVALATVVFSVMTALCGLAASFVQLALARIGVGIGEAGASPPSHAILADLYRPHERATAMAIFALGVNLGILIGFLAGGWINEFFGWRAAFLVVGAPGLLLALLARTTLREPPRGQSEGREGEAGAAAPPRMRTLASAVLLFVINIIGLGLGPQAVGILSDLLASRFGEESLRYALLLAGLVNLWSALHFFLAGRTLTRDLAR